MKQDAVVLLRLPAEPHPRGLLIGWQAAERMHMRKFQRIEDKANELRLMLKVLPQEDKETLNEPAAWTCEGWDECLEDLIDAARAADDLPPED